MHSRSNDIALGILKAAGILFAAFVLAPQLKNFWAVILGGVVIAIAWSAFRESVEENGWLRTLGNMLLWSALACAWLYLVVGYFILHNVSDENGGYAFIALAVVSALVERGERRRAS